MEPIKNSGIILIDKPVGVTSHHVVSTCRKILNEEKVGHLGTLDPFASGLLPILVGGATRLADELMPEHKQYLFTTQLGTETDTLDSLGQTVDQKSVPPDFPEKIESALKAWIGHKEQIPPAYSALKMQGRPLYEYMRATGKLPESIESKKRVVWIETLECVSFHPQENTLTVRALCGKGTYVRSLARDLAQLLGTVGHCIALRREKVGVWSVAEAYPFVAAAPIAKNDLASYLIPPERVLPHLPHLLLGSVHTKMLSSGNVLICSPEEIHLAPLGLASALPLLNKEEKAHAYVGIQGLSLLFYAEISQGSELETLKISPQKTHTTLGYADLSLSLAEGGFTLFKM